MSAGARWRVPEVGAREAVGRGLLLSLWIMMVVVGVDVRFRCWYYCFFFFFWPRSSPPRRRACNFGTRQYTVKKYTHVPAAAAEMSRPLSWVTIPGCGQWMGHVATKLASRRMFVAKAKYDTKQCKLWPVVRTEYLETKREVRVNFLK